MKLPEIDTGTVQDITRVNDPVVAAQREMFKGFEHGLTLLGQEMVKSQAGRATADLLSGVNDLTLKLNEKKTMSTQEVKDALGPAYESLPPEILAQTVKQIPNPMTGELDTFDREDVPTFAVASHIFDAQSKKLLGEVSQKISGQGWQADFQEKASHELLAHKMKLAEKQLKDAHDLTQVQDTQTAIDLAASGNAPEARKFLASSRTMDLDYKSKVEAHITKLEETKPVFDAIREQDFGSMAAQLGQLNDPKQFTSLTPQERTVFSERLKAEIRGFEVAADRHKKALIEQASQNGWNGIFAKERAGAPVSFADIPPPGSIPATDQKEMIAYVEKLNKGEKPETDFTTYAALSEIASKNKEAFQGVNLLQYRNKLSDADLKHLIDVQNSAKGAGDPDSYDQFQTTDEAINFRLQANKVDPYVKDSNEQQRVGYVKTIIQHELASEQRSKKAKLSVEERDAVIDRVVSREIDPKEGWFSGLTLPALKAGVPATVAAEFRRAVQALDPKGMTNRDGREKTLKTQYRDYSFYEPKLEVAWQVQRGANPKPSDLVDAWYRLKRDWGRLEGQLRATGGWTENVELRKERIVQLAVQEMTKGRR